MTTEQIWKTSWDKGLKDLQPKEYETTFNSLFKETFDRFPDKPALVYLGKKITFRELDHYSDQFANLLIKHGFKKGDIVGINLPNTPQYVIAVTGTLKAGCILSGVSPLLSASQLEYQLNDLGGSGKKTALVTLDVFYAETIIEMVPRLSNLKMVITTGVADFAPRMKKVIGKILNKIPSVEILPAPGITILDFKSKIQNKPSNTPVRISVLPDDTGWIQYTGGTTGDSKGAMLSQRSVAHNMISLGLWSGLEKGKGVMLSGFPMFHIAGITICQNALYMGITQILVPNPRDTDFLCKAINKYKPTTMVNVPSLYQILMANPAFKRLDHSSLEMCISGASPFPVDSQTELEKTVGKGKLLEIFGMTETSGCSVLNPYKGQKKLGTIGLPILNVDAKIVDIFTGERVPLGEPGEICFKGPVVMQGYFNKPQETEKVMDKEGFFHTGDVGIMDKQGYIRIVDRTKDMINVGGYKVFSTKVEDILCEHPAVELVALIGMPHPDRPGSELVKAVIQLKPNYKPCENQESVKGDILRFAKNRCAPYEVPKVIDFVEKVPLTPVGKLDKKALRIRCANAN